MNTTPRMAHRGHRPARVVLAAPVGHSHHFAGLAAALESHGVDSSLECAQLGAPVRVPGWIARGTDVLVHAESVGARAAGIELAAERAGRPLVLIMDGVCEYGNTCLNPDAGARFLRPAPADVVLAAGAHDRGILRALGNRAVATGLPRLDRFARAVRDICPYESGSDLLIATARRPSPSPQGQARVLAALVELREACARRRVPVRWRVGRELAGELGVVRDTLPLAASLERARAVITTASTLALEAMIAGRPTGVLHPHPWPRWLPAVWVWSPTAVHDANGSTSISGQVHAATEAARRSADAALQGDGVAYGDAAELIAAVLAPTRPGLAAQHRVLAQLCCPRGTARCARVISSVARRRRVPQRKINPAGRAGETRPSRSVRVLSFLEEHASTVGGVSVWSERLERYFDEHPGLGIEWNTVLIGAGATAEHEKVAERRRAREHRVDPTAPGLEQIRGVAGLIREASADVVVPNDSPLAHAAATHTHRRGTRTLAVAHTDDLTTRQLIRAFPAWDAAVGVSARCALWLRADHAENPGPVRTIVYGVPEHPPRPAPTGPPGPLRIAAIGRVIEEQKRVGDLIRVLDALHQDGISFRFELVGDGPALPAWLREIGRTPVPAEWVRATGAVSPAEVQTILPRLDVLVNVSDAEGTCISMLEGMAAGVVPCVTRVSSGIEGLLVHRGNSMTVPVGDTDAMAACLAELARDRSLLVSLSRAAQRTIARHGLTVPACAERYAELIHEMVAAPPRTARASPIALRLPGEEWRVRGAVTAGELRETLDELGCPALSEGERVAMRGHDGLGARIVGATEPHPGSQWIQRQRNQGGVVVVEPHMDDEEGAHLTRAARELSRESHARIVVMATCARLFPAIEWLARHRRADIAAVVVPGAKAGSVLLGIPARPCPDALTHDDEVLLLASAGIDTAGLIAALAHHTDENRLRFAPPTVPGVVSRIRAAIDDLETLDPARVLTTLPSGVMPVVESISAAALISGGVPAGTRGVLLRGEEADFAVAARLEGWIRAGGRLYSAAWPTEELRAPARYAAAVKNRPGSAPHAVYGAGQHTERVLAHAPAGTPRPVLILDDAAPRGRSLAGIPVVAPGTPEAGAARVIVLSSTVHEQAMWERCSVRRTEGTHVVRLYDEEQTAS